jgi:hypothetical protein
MTVLSIAYPCSRYDKTSDLISGIINEKFTAGIPQLDY